MMRRTGILLALLLIAPVAFAGDWYRLYWGGDSTACLYPTATAAITDWTVTGAATAHEALDDLTTVPCYAGKASDSDTTIITCPAATTTCTVTLDLANTPATGFVDIVAVSAWGVMKRGAGSTMTSPAAKMYFRIGAVDYLACTISPGGTDYGSSSQSNCGLTATSPATATGWTAAELDGMQLKITKEASASYDLVITAAGIGVAYTGGE